MTFFFFAGMGRSCSFWEYWTRYRHDQYSREALGLYNLDPPRFRTTGDLAVSSLNYDTFFHKLRCQAGGQPEKMNLDQYLKFQAAGFRLEGPFKQVSSTPNRSMNPESREVLLQWASQDPFVCAVLGNLAANGMIREICESPNSRSASQRQIKEAFLASWLRRETKAEHRPSDDSPEHLALYLQLIEEVAAKYLREDKLGRDGYFDVNSDDAVTITHKGVQHRVRVNRILDRSGLAELDLQTIGDRRYRFEPLWMHRLFVERYNDRMQQQIANRPAQ